jgi:hypothetical protein
LDSNWVLKINLTLLYLQSIKRLGLKKWEKITISAHRCIPSGAQNFCSPHWLYKYIPFWSIAATKVPRKLWCHPDFITTHKSFCSSVSSPNKVW